MIGSAIKFVTPTESHSAPLARLPAADPSVFEAERREALTDQALDTYDLQALLDLRNRIEKRLPARSLKDIDLQQELVLQVRALQELQTRVLQDGDTSPAHRAQVANSLSAALANLNKVQQSAYTAERLKQAENILIQLLNAHLPPEAIAEFTDQWEAALSALDE